MSKTKTTGHEPFVRIAKRTSVSMKRKIIVRLAAVILALLASALFIYFITGLNPVAVYKAMFQGAFGGTTLSATVRRSWITIRDTMFLLTVSVALAPAFKMKFWNIGAEGQVLMGGIVTAGIMIYFGESMPAALLLMVMFAASCLAGALWGLIPAIFKAKWNTNETLFTLMMNYVAIQLTSFCVALWENPYGSNSVGIINQNSMAGWFPSIFGKAYMLNVILAMAVTIGVYLYMKKSKQGYEISVVGESQDTAKYAGISVKKVIIRTMLISGAICGMAGFMGVAGIDHTISTNTVGGRGFTAIIVAWLAKFNTYTMIAIALLLTFLDRGAAEIASQFGLNEFASDVVSGIILFFILGSEFFCNYKVIVSKKTKKEEA